jgi:serine/threonine protein kinase
MSLAAGESQAPDAVSQDAAWTDAESPDAVPFDPDETPSTPMPVYVHPGDELVLVEPILSDCDQPAVATETTRTDTISSWETYFDPDIDLDSQADTVFLNMESGIIAGVQPRDSADSGAQAASKSTREKIVYTPLPFPVSLGEKYELTGLIACGGTATVYQATHRAKKHMVAVKLPDMRNDYNGHLARKFRAAAVAWSRLRSARIAAVQEFGIADNNTPFLVMEFVDGKTLAEILDEQKSLPPERFVEVFDQVCRALRVAHQAGIPHRDIKPSNILIAEKNGLWITKVSDFGIVKQIENSAGIDLSRIGEVYGTPQYMSPEQCMGRQPDIRSDMFALGCVMYQAATGTLPGGGDNLMQTLQKRLTESPKSFQELGITFPKHLERAIFNCLERDPDRRCQSVDKVQRELLRGWKRRVKAIVKRIRRIQPREVKAMLTSVAVLGLIGTGIWLGWMYLQPYNAPQHWQKYEEALQNHDDRKATSNLVSIIENAPVDPRLTTTAYLYATDLARRGNFARAEDILESQVKNFGKSKMKQLEKANTLILYGGVLTKQGNDFTARPVYEQLVALQRTYKSSNVTTGQAHQYLGDIATREKRPADAAHHYRKAIQLFGNEAGWVAGAAANYASLLQEQRNYADAERMFTLAKESWLKANGTKSTTTVYGTTLLGQFYLKTRRLEGAKDNFRESLQMLRGLTKDSQYLTERARLLANYTLLLKRQRRLKDLPKIEALLPRQRYISD